METLIIHTEGEKLKTIQNLLKLLDIKFEKVKDKSLYNQDIAKKILETKNEDNFNFEQQWARSISGDELRERTKKHLKSLPWKE